MIENILPRSSLLYRSDAFREKLFAANVTQVVVVIASVPSYDENILNAALMAADAADVGALIVLNKTDLEQETARAKNELAVYQKMGYPLLTLSAQRDVSALREHLSNQTSVLLGESGMGKSTLLNALLPDAMARIGDISAALDSGKHTTTATRLYHLDSASHLIDSPGFQEFGLFHLDDAQVAASMREFRGLIGNCRFNNCRHTNEPGCAVTADRSMHPRRLAFYQNLIAQNDALRAMNPALGGATTKRK